ncbi:hypothetical protein [Maridesulfovibrio bastinii]|uniref:hypothetical protein n=1 Tax=Maridesulfovibrio bastinii TaxID=47157 RepID=UPI0004204A8D|nr:hypothetical protein [Maridesulfovibrio bastinii]
MISIEKSQVINYGQSQTVTVYGDDKEKNKYYVIPQPRIAIAPNGDPAFSLVKIESNSSAESLGVSGECTFQTDIYVSDEIRAAVRKELGQDITFGQLDWLDAFAVFTFEVNGTKLTQRADASLYADNKVSFVISLPDNNSYESFKNAFGPDGSAGGTFTVSYQLSTFAALPPATVTVSFDSNTAYEYQKTVHVSKNMWGHVTNRSVEVHQLLSQSMAGKVTVDPGSRTLSESVLKRLTDWGNQTLQNDVDKSIQEVLTVIGEKNADNFSCSMMPSFNNVYEEGQVINWLVTPQATIPAFDETTWEKISSTIDVRNLNVAFAVQSIPDTVDSVTVVVDYPTAKTDNTHQFKADESGSWIFKAVGDMSGGAFNPEYKYHYKVEYNDGTEPYTSPITTSTDTQIFINIRDLKRLTVKFIAWNVPFSDEQVKRVEVNFYFVNDNDGAVTHQNIELNKDKTTDVVESNTMRPSTNSYQFRTTYYMADNTKVMTGWVTDNAIQNVLTPPLVSRVISLFTLGDFSLVAVDAQYNDKTNGLVHNHQWALQGSAMTPQPWFLTVPNSADEFIISYSGEYESGGKLTMIQHTDIGTSIINVSTAQSVQSVKFQASEVEWSNKNITKVNLQVYRINKSGNKTDMFGRIFTPENLDDFLWDFLYDSGTTPTYYWEAQYWHKNVETPTNIKRTKQSGQTIVVLPGDAD